MRSFIKFLASLASGLKSCMQLTLFTNNYIVAIDCSFIHVCPLGTGLLCLNFYLLCYAAVLIEFTYYARNYAQE